MKPTLSGFAILVDAKSSRGRLSPEQEFRRQNGFVAYLKSPDEIVEYALRKEREFLALKRKQPR